MAEKGYRDGNVRRPSFRKTLNDGTLPPEYLESLEQKRKQLDESIHKYIAAKEREYKLYERDLKHQLKLVQHDGDREIADRAPTSTLTHDSDRGRPLELDGGLDAERHSYGNDVVLVEGDGAQISSKSTLSAHTNRRASHQERDQELVGLFTPAFLPALGHPGTSVLLRTSSEPPSILSAARDDPPAVNVTARANSDTAVPVTSKRPNQLQLTHRTSSSGSSADGKLTSALKSPTQPSKAKRKRVSLAVGDAIVAPSDSVPVAMSNNSTPSHSRTRASISVAPDAPIPETSSVPFPSLAEPSTQGAVGVDAGDSALPSRGGRGPGPSEADPSSLPLPSPRTIDPDGDLFDLEDVELNPFDEDAKFGNPFESEDAVIGRIDQNSNIPVQLSQSPEVQYDEDEGVVPEYDDKAGDHVDFRPGSATASQQPTSPGFRRPSVSMDPVYTGNDWTRAEHEAVVDDVYGSSYTRPNSKGSLTAGSLGESYMARNAEKLLRHRMEKEQSQTRPQ